VTTGKKFEELIEHFGEHRKANNWNDVPDGWRVFEVEAPTSPKQFHFKFRAPIESKLLTRLRAARKEEFDAAVLEQFKSYQVDPDEPWN